MPCFFLLQAYIFADCDPIGFLRYNTNSAKIEDAYDFQDPYIIYWGAFVKDFGLDIYEFNTSTVPYYLQLYTQDFHTQTSSCIDQWNYYGCLDLSYGTTGVQLEYSTDANIFPTGTEYGGTVFAVVGSDEDWEFTYYNAGSPTGSPQTMVYLNNSQSFPWLCSLDLQNPGVDYTPFKPIIFHELGHVIGLGHIANTDGSYLMSLGRTHNNFLFSLTACDISALQSLCDYNGTPVGVEDEIYIVNGTVSLNPGNSFSYTAQFYDTPPASYMTNWYWEIVFYHGEGEYVYLSYSTNQYNSYSYWFSTAPNLPSGYCWSRDQNNNVMGRVRVYGVDSDNHWHSDYLDITIQNIQGNTTSGTLTHNETWCGVVNITGNITVPSNITLEILPNTNIYFQSSNNLTVYGTLVANSDAARKIDFMRTGSSGSWGSITFDGSGASNSILNYITVKNGLGIRCLNGANVTVTNSTIDHCTEGVYIYNSQPNISGNQIIEPVQNGINVNASGLSPLIQGNNITKSSSNPQYRQYQGIYLSNNSNGYIAKNDISGFYWGMYIGGGSDAYFTNYSNQSFTQNNRVINNRWGLGAGWGGYIFAGMWKSYGRNNSIYNNLNCDAYSYNSSNIIAQSNWWGNDGAQIYHDGTSTLDASLPLTYDPWIPQNNVLLEESELLGDESVNQIIIPDSSIILGILLEFRGRTNEAIFHYKQMIKNKRKADFAIGRLVSIMNRDNVIEIREFIESLLFGNNDYKPIVLTVLAGKLLEENKYEEAKILYNRIINDYPDSYFAINARFEKFFAALSIEHNLNTASELLNEIRALALNDVDYLIRL